MWGYWGLDRAVRLKEPITEVLHPDAGKFGGYGPFRFGRRRLTLRVSYRTLA